MNINQKGFVNVILIVLVIVIVGTVGYFSLVKKSSTQPEVQPQLSKPINVILYAYEKDGTHIFDGAIIAAIDKTSGRIVTEEVANGDGRIVFSLPSGSYRFQPSPLRENRVVGILDLIIKEPQEVILLLTEVGPAAFGAPVISCEAKQGAIEAILENADYCTNDADCEFIQPGGFSCWTYINQAYNTSILFNRINEYIALCGVPAYKCPTVTPAVCKIGKCVSASQ